MLIRQERSRNSMLQNPGHTPITVANAISTSLSKDEEQITNNTFTSLLSIKKNLCDVTHIGLKPLFQCNVQLHS